VGLSGGRRGGRSDVTIRRADRKDYAALLAELGESARAVRLLGAADKSALDDRVAAAREFAVANHVILVLKGARPLVATPDGRVVINPTGNAGLGTAGAGDTLTGLISGFLAQDPTHAITATIAALYVGGLAGDFAAKKLGMRTMLASDIREHFGDATRSLDPLGESV